MYRLDHGVRGRRQEAIDVVRTRDRLGLGATVAPVFGPDAREREQRSTIVEREPDDILRPVSPVGRLKSPWFSDCARTTNQSA
jgi:hypothetical protein